MKIETRWHKRVPAEIAGEYIAKGWHVLSIENRTILLVWPQEGAPP